MTQSSKNSQPYICEVYKINISCKSLQTLNVTLRLSPMTQTITDRQTADAQSIFFSA